MNSGKNIAVLGDGGWGTAVSIVLAGNGHDVRMWGHDAEYLGQMNSSRENIRFLPGRNLPENISFEPDMGAAVAGVDLAIVAVPTKFLRAVFGNKRGVIPASLGIVSLTKGIECSTLLRPSEIFKELLDCNRVAALSGPSHAEEVVRMLPASVTIASTDRELATAAQEILMSKSFRVYTSSDIIGVELGGALKNVIAIAAGICNGLNLGDNALSALMTRGLAEMSRMGEAMGADASTFAGLSGMGDLITTCVSPHGRNRSVGIELGRGKKLEQIIGDMHGMVAEGVTTAESAYQLGKKQGIELPITEQVYAVLYENKPPREAVAELMSRAGRDE